MRCMHHDSRPITASAVARLDCGFCPVTSLPSTTPLTCQLGAVSTSAPSSRKRLSSRKGSNTPTQNQGRANTKQHQHQRSEAVTDGGDDAAFLHDARDELGDLV